MQEQINLNDLSGLINIELLSKQIVEGFVTGLHKSPFHGFSVEFAEHKIYNAGESVKNIDWKLYARSNKLFSKKYEEETNLRCQIIIDSSSSMFYPPEGLTKFKYAVLATACIMQMLKKQRDAFGLSTFADNIEIHTEAKSTYAHQKVLLNQLEKVWNSTQKNKTTSIAKNLHLLADMIHRRSMVVLFSDFIFEGQEDFDQILSAIQHLKYNKHELIIFKIQEPEFEIDFKFENKPFHFIDSETGRELKLNPLIIKEKYLERTKHHHNQLFMRCAQLKVTILEVNMNKGYKDLLNAWLIKRNGMY